MVPVYISHNRAYFFLDLNQERHRNFNLDLENQLPSFHKCSEKLNGKNMVPVCLLCTLSPFARLCSIAQSPPLGQRCYQVCVNQIMHARHQVSVSYWSEQQHGAPLSIIDANFQNQCLVRKPAAYRRSPTSNGDTSIATLLRCRQIGNTRA